MTKFFALLMCLCIFSAQAESGFRGSLKTAFDELTYSLTVEWDQNDKEFYQKQVTNFQNQVIELKKQGLTNEELLDFLISNIQDKAAAQDLKQIYELASAQKLSQVEIENLTKELMSRHYAQGSAWIGTVLLIGAGLIVLVVGATALMLWDASNNPDDCSYDYVCQPDGTGCSYQNYHCN